MATFDFIPYAQSERDWTNVGAGTALDHVPCVVAAGDSKIIQVQDLGSQSRDSYTLNPASIPSITSISQVEIYSTVQRSGSTDSRLKFFVQLGSTRVYGPENDGHSYYFSTTGALARPGGGSWTSSDLSSLIFGVEINKALNSGVYFGVDNLYVTITYVAAAAPVANFTATPLSGFNPLSVTFTDTSSNTPTSWDWDYGDSTTHGTTQNPTHPYANPGTYTVTLTATNSSGSGSVTKTSYITVNASSTDLQAGFSCNYTSGSTPFAVQFTDTTTGTPAPTTWSWTFGDGGTSTLQNPSHAYMIAGTYSVSLTATRAGGTGADTSTVTKSNLIVAADGRPTPTISYVATPATLRRPVSFAFTGSATNNPTTWAWTFSDGSTSDSQNPVHVFTTAGAAWATLATTNPAGTKSTTSNFTILPAKVTASFTASPTFGVAPLVVQFKDTSTGDVVSWGWTFGDTGTSTSQSPSHTYTTAGTYTVALQVVNGSDNSTSTQTNYVCVLPAGASYADFLDELWNHLIEPLPSSTAYLATGGFTRFGGITKVLRVTYDRLVRFLLDTGLLRKEATITGSSGLYALPTDLVELRRLEADSYAILPVDQLEADLSQGSLSGVQYIRDPLPDGLSIQLVPASNVTTLKAWYVPAPTLATVPTGCGCVGTPWGGGGVASPWSPFPLPYVLWWPVKYGVLAELLSQEGEMNDPARARACEELYSAGVELTKFIYGGQ